MKIGRFLPEIPRLTLTVALATPFVGMLTFATAACDTSSIAPPTDTFSKIYADPTFQMCADCHAPGAPGFTSGTEATQNWSSRDAAFNSLKGNASGLIGNFAGCNGVPLVGDTSSTSLIVAVFDPDVRKSFSVPGHPDCNAAAITDETLRVGAISPATLQELKDFIDMGGFR